MRTFCKNIKPGITQKAAANDLYQKALDINLSFFTKRIPEQESISLLKKRIFNNSNMFPALRKTLTKDDLWRTDNYHLEKQILVNPDISSQEQLSSFLNELEVNNTEILNQQDHPQWRWFIFPNFEGNQSAYIFQIGHAYFDGANLLKCFFHITDEGFNNAGNLNKLSKNQTNEIFSHSGQRFIERSKKPKAEVDKLPSEEFYKLLEIHGYESKKSTYFSKPAEIIFKTLPMKGKIEKLNKLGISLLNLQTAFT